MDIPTLTAFFMWCTIINVVILIVWAIIFGSAPDFMYRILIKWFPMPRETFNVVVYSGLAMFRILFVVFFLVPFVALLIVG